MSDTVLALIAGLSAGLAVALGFILLYTRSQRRSASDSSAAVTWSRLMPLPSST